MKLRTLILSALLTSTMITSFSTKAETFEKAAGNFSVAEVGLSSSAAAIAVLNLPASAFYLSATTLLYAMKEYNKNNKQLIQMLKNDVNELEVSGNISPALEQSLNNIREKAPEMSDEEILDLISNL